MAARAFLRILALVGAVLTAVDGQFTINVELSRSTAHVGDDFTATCHVHNDQKKQFFILWVRQSAGQTTEIASNQIVNFEFRSTGRYSANATMDNGVDMGDVTFCLTISALEAADSGKIGCKIASQNIEVFKHLTVFVPVQSVKLTSQYTNGTHAVAYVDGQMVSFHEGDSRRFFCHVNGSYPAPKIALMAGGKDVADSFKREVRVVKKGNVKGLEDVTYDVTLSKDNFKLDYSMSGKMLQCVATLPASGFVAKTLGIDIEMAGYKPRFDCYNRVASPIHKEGVNITCVVHADPPASKVRVSWNRYSSGELVSLATGEEDGHYTTYTDDTTPDSGMKMVLRIDRVFTQHFRTYYFHAENAIGNSTMEICLVQEGTSELKTGTGATWMASHALLVLVATFWLL